MDKIIDLLAACTPVIVAITAMLVVIQGWRLKKVEKHTNGMQDKLMTLTEEKGLARGRLQESEAAAIGETRVGTPLTTKPPLLVSEDTKKAIIAKFLEDGKKPTGSS